MFLAAAVSAPVASLVAASALPMTYIIGEGANLDAFVKHCSRCVYLSRSYHLF